jgi:hypothetical protein
LLFAFQREYSHVRDKAWSFFLPPDQYPPDPLLILEHPLTQFAVAPWLEPGSVIFRRPFNDLVGLCQQVTTPIPM